VSGVGKSWLAATCPKPLLVLDAEGRARYAPSGPKIAWNPLTEPPPALGVLVEYHGEMVPWQTCVVTVVDFSTIAQVYQWLRSGQHPFVSVVIDSIMEVQRRCKMAIRPGTSPLERDDWGQLLREIEKLICDYRDLVHIESNGVKVVLFISGTHSETLKPRMDGAIRENLPYYIDVVGYMFKSVQADGTWLRQMLVDEQPPFTAKDGTDRLKAHYGPVIPLPDNGTQYVEQFYTLLYNGGSNPTPTTEAV
jgi:hypothetical protein